MRKNRDEHREKMRERSYKLSLSNRDIAPLHPVRNPARRQQCRNSIMDFCLEYFPEKFKKPFGEHHKQFMRRLEQIIRYGGKQAIAMPRGTGKTTIMIVAAVWALVYGYRRFVMIIGATKKDATKILRAIKSSVTRNRPMGEDFPEVCHPLRLLKGSALLARGQLYYGNPTEIEWTAERIKFPAIPGSDSSGSVVVTAGIGSSIRGQNDEMPDGGTARPDLVLLDDTQTQDKAVNPNSVEKLEETINSTVEGLAGDGEELAMVMSCTVIAENDAADRYLNIEIYPHWNGLRFAMLEKFPDRMDLWKEYRVLRHKSIREADKFYELHLEEMRAGGAVSWPESYNRRDTLDALQRAMNLWCDNERSFWSERQNRPLRRGNTEVRLTPDVIRSRCNGLAKGLVPADAVAVTHFVDVHNDVLYWGAAAWAADFTGWIIDYGTFPEQRMNSFVKGGSDVATLKQTFTQESTIDGALLRGLEFLFRDLTGRQYRMEAADDVDAVYMNSKLLLADSKFKPEIVEAAIRRVGSSVIMPSRGVSVRATSKPLDQYEREPGMIKGRYWLEKRVKGRSFRGLHVDTNHWKTRVHEAFSLQAGERGGVSLWGSVPNRHKMFSEHLCAEDVRTAASGGREVNEWKELPNRPDNHFFDVAVGLMAGASRMGMMSQAERDNENRPRRRGSR
jgi:hypothetical protein